MIHFNKHPPARRECKSEYILARISRGRGNGMQRCRIGRRDLYVRLGQGTPVSTFLASHTRRIPSKTPLIKIQVSLFDTQYAHGVSRNCGGHLPDESKCRKLSRVKSTLLLESRPYPTVQSVPSGATVRYSGPYGLVRMIWACPSSVRWARKKLHCPAAESGVPACPYTAISCCRKVGDPHVARAGDLYSSRQT